MQSKIKKALHNQIFYGIIKRYTGLLHHPRNSSMNDDKELSWQKPIAVLNVNNKKIYNYETHYTNKPQIV